MFGNKFKFTAKDNDMADAEISIARILDKGGQIISAPVQLIVSALGRKHGGNYSLNVQRHNDGTHNVWIDEE